MEKIAVIGGLGTLSGGDLFFKLLKNKEVLRNQLDYYFIFEQQPYNQINMPLNDEADIKSRKYYTYNVCKNFEKTDVTKILLPCFASHSFIEELQKEIEIPIVNIFNALENHITTKFKKDTKIGVLTSNFVKNLPIDKKYLSGFHLVFPDKQDLIMEAIYGEIGIKNGYLDGVSLEQITTVCLNLLDQGCEVILPMITEISLVSEQLWKRGIPVIDVNQIYADYALGTTKRNLKKIFKLGIMGGVGPAATVDFMNKIIESTPAEKDQDHIKMIVEQNPQIPDRTANLVRKETDPTIAMYSTCKRLEAEGADAIAIPCNTAHAFVESIQEHLKIPIINMLKITAEFILDKFGSKAKVGLLATSGTIQSHVYHEIFKEFNFKVVVPDEMHQQFVMESIYGDHGVKAGFQKGVCKDNIMKAADHLIDNNVDIVILGCTELPLMFKNETEIIRGSKRIPLVDPTLILAKKIVNIVF